MPRILLQMEHYWQECLRLPPRIQEWDAYKEMRDAVKLYLDVFPILHKLNSKVLPSLLPELAVIIQLHLYQSIIHYMT